MEYQDKWESRLNSGTVTKKIICLFIHSANSYWAAILCEAFAGPFPGLEDSQGQELVHPEAETEQVH